MKFEARLEQHSARDIYVWIEERAQGPAIINMVVTGLPEHFALYTCMAHMTLLQGDASSSARRAEKITLGEHWEDSSTVLETRKEKGVREKIRTRTAIFIATWCLCKKQLSSAASPSTFILYNIPTSSWPSASSSSLSSPRKWSFRHGN